MVIIEVGSIGYPLSSMHSLKQHYFRWKSTGSLHSASSTIKRAFTVIEALVAVAVIGVVGSISYLALSGTSRTAEEVKLRSDVGALNRAISIYRSNGGDVSGIENPSEMLVRLKTAMSAEDATAQPGLTSAMIDTRIVAVLQTATEAAEEGTLRAHWNSGSHRFDLSTSGPPGIKRFAIDDGEILDEFESEQRNSFLKFATTNDWVWKYSDKPHSDRVTPTPLARGSEWTEEVSVDPVWNPGRHRRWRREPRSGGYLTAHRLHQRPRGEQRRPACLRVGLAWGPRRAMGGEGGGQGEGQHRTQS